VVLLVVVVRPGHGHTDRGARVEVLVAHAGVERDVVRVEVVVGRRGRGWCPGLWRERAVEPGVEFRHCHVLHPDNLSLFFAQQLST
jgi:hypothetical protein